MHHDSAATSAEDPRADALVLLIEQSQKLFATYDARRGNAVSLS